MHFFNLYSGGWGPIGSTGHCGHYRAIVPALDDYVDGEIGGMIGRGNLPQCRFVHHKPHMLPRRKPGPLQWEASDQPLEQQPGLFLMHAL
jgi:hypothetical protein